VWSHEYGSSNRDCVGWGSRDEHDAATPELGRRRSSAPRSGQFASKMRRVSLAAAAHKIE
jgi:hypothetical protein